MWSMALSLAPKLLGFLSKKSANNPKTGLIGLAAGAGILGQVGSPESIEWIRNVLASALQVIVNALRVTPGA